MKIEFSTFGKAVLIGAAAFAVFSCGREQDAPIQEQPQGSVRTVRFHADAVATRAQFGEEENGSWPTLWTSNDAYAKLSLNFGGAQQAQITTSADFRSADFSAEIDFADAIAPYTYYAVSPSSAAKALSPSREAWKVTIPCEQTPSAASVDESGIILAATSESYADTESASKVNLYFYHLTAYGRLSLSNLDLQEGETVSSVELTVTTPLVGDWYWKCEDGTLTDYGASSTITIQTSATEGIWFACAPVAVGGEALVVRVYTNLGVHEQLTAFPDGAVFEPGMAAIFTINMDGADFNEGGSGNVSTPVTVSMSSFSDISGNVGGDENVSYAASQGDATSAPAVYDNVIRIYQNGGLLTVSANNGKTITNVTIGSSMATRVQVRTDSGSFGSDNSITANGTYSTGTISASTVVFKCTGTTKTARLYLNSLSVSYSGSGSSASAGPDPLLENSDYGCYLGTSALTRTLQSGTDQVTRSYNADGVETYTIIGPDEVEELEISGYKKSFVKGDTVELTINWRRGNTSVYSGSLSTTLIKEDGPKVWLSAGNGIGVIIKK